MLLYITMIKFLSLTLASLQDQLKQQNLQLQVFYGVGNNYYESYMYMYQTYSVHTVRLTMRMKLEYMYLH